MAFIPDEEENTGFTPDEETAVTTNQKTTQDILAERDANFSPENLSAAGKDLLSGNLASVSGGKALLEYMLREEAATAQPVLNAMQAHSPTFGEKPAGTMVEGFLEGVKGDTFSKHKQFEQAQLGDLFREMNAPEPVAAVGGLALSGLLPSSLIGGKIVGGTSKVTKKTSSLIGHYVSSLKRKGVKKAVQPSEEATNLINTFRNLDKNAKLGKSLSAEAVESLTNIKSDEVLYAFENPEILTRVNARPERVKDIAKDAFEALDGLRKKGSLALSPPDQLPLQIATNITESFDNAIKTAGDNVGIAKRTISNTLKQEAKATGKVRGINSGQLNAQVNMIMDKMELLDDAGKVKPAFKGSKVVSALKDIKRIIKETSDVPGEMSSLLDASGKQIVKKEAGSRVLEFDDLLDIKKSIQDVAYAHSVAGADGILKPIPEVERALRKIGGVINSTVKKEFKDFPELQKSYDKFSRLAEVRSDISARLRDPEKMAKFIRRIDKTNLEDIEELSRLIEVLPNRENAIKEIKRFIDLKENTISGKLSLTNIDSKNDVLKKLEAIFSKPLSGEGAIPIPVQEGLIRLERASGKSLIKPLLDHKIAASFSQKSNFFRALAAGSIVSGGLAGNPLVGLATFAGGLALTDPRIQGKAINVAGKASKFLNKPIPKFASSALKRGTSRKLVEEFLPSDED